MTPQTRKDIQDQIKAAKAAKKDAFHRKNAALAELRKGRDDHSSAAARLADLQEQLRRFDAGER